MSHGLPSFTGIVLAGGASSRMGRDKAFIEIDGRSLVAIAVDALRAADASRVLVIGGDPERIADLAAAHDDVEARADQHPGEGPLGGIITGLQACTDPLAMVLACDMPTIDGGTVARIVAALAAHPTAQIGAPRVGDRYQILTAAYRRSVLPVLDAAFAAGERAPRRALESVELVEAVGIDPERLADVDRPQDLSRYARPGPTTPAPREAQP